MENLRKPRIFMYLIVIAWIYVVLMMSVAEATNSNGSILGSLVTFILYGVGPVTLVVYLMGAPARNKAIKQREAQARAMHIAAEHPTESLESSSIQPDTGGHTTRGAETIAPHTSTGITPVGKKS